MLFLIVFVVLILCSLMFMSFILFQFEAVYVQFAAHREPDKFLNEISPTNQPTAAVLQPAEIKLLDF